MGFFDKLAEIFKPSQDKIHEAAQGIKTGGTGWAPMGGASTSASSFAPAKTGGDTSFGSPKTGNFGTGFGPRGKTFDDTGFGPTELPSSSPAPSAGFVPPTGKLSSRAYKHGLDNGENYSRYSNDQKDFTYKYYGLLDRRDITDDYEELEGYLGSKDTVSQDIFDKRYKSIMGTYDSRLSLVKDRYGEGSKEYAAWKQVRQDFEDLGRRGRGEYASKMRDEMSAGLDSGINRIFDGIISRPDYAATVEAGKKAVEKDADAKRWFFGGSGKKWIHHGHANSASEDQLNLMYYTYQKEGLAGVKELYNDYFGETLAYMDAINDFVSDIGNDNEYARFWEGNKANWAAALDGQWWGGTKQTFSNTKADEDDRTLVGDYSVDDAVDNALRKELGDLANDPSFQFYGSEGFSQMLAGGMVGDWADEARKRGTTLQKQLLGYTYLNTNGDVNAVAEAWDEIKSEGDMIWQTVNGANSLPTRASSIEGQLYRDYYGMSGAKKPSWLGNPSDSDEMTVAQTIWDMALTTRAQYPQIAVNIAGSLISPGLGRILGGAVMATSVYGNAYKEAVDQGYTGKAAVGYASTQALSEFAVGQLLDGVGSVGGILTSKAGERFVKNIANPFVRAMIDVGVRGFNEGLEEYTQEISEPLIRNLWFGEDNDVKLFSEEALYSFFLGASSAMLMGVPGGQAKTRIDQGKLGKALNTQKSTLKLIDTILNSDVEGKTKAQKEFINQAKGYAQMMKDGRTKQSDVNVGEMAQAAMRGGIDVSFLTNPKTVAYTKENITVDDMAAGAVSRLGSLKGDTSLAEDIAKMAMGEKVSSEIQDKINNDPIAKQVLEELQGDLDMDTDNALTRAAHMTTKDGKLAKRAQAVQDYNPDMTILTPMEEYLKTEGMGLADARKVGAVLNKVLDGKTLTKQDAKLINVKSSAIQAALLTKFDIDISQYAKPAEVLAALNKKAAEFADVKDKQAAVKESTKTAGRVFRRKAYGNPQAGRGEAEAQEGLGEAGQRGSGAAEAGGPGGVSPVLGERQGEHEQKSAPRGRTRRGVKPGKVSVEKLTPEQRKTQSRAASNGFSSVTFWVGKDSGAEYDPKLGGWFAIIRTGDDAVFTEDQYVDHETGHLWIAALTEDQRREFLRAIKLAFGEDFETAFNQVKALYVRKGYRAEGDDSGVVEEMYCLARGSQNFSGKAKDGKSNIIDKDCQFDFAQYHDVIMEIEAAFHLEALAKNDQSDPVVAEMIQNGQYNQTFYEQMGYLDEDAAEEAYDETSLEDEMKTAEPAATVFRPAKEAKTSEAKTEEKKPTPIPSAEKVEKQKKAKKQKSLEDKARGSKAWNYTSEEDVNALYDQRKAAAQRKFNQGKTHQNYDNDADRQAALDLELEELDQLREITLKHVREQARVEEAPTAEPAKAPAAEPVKDAEAEEKKPTPIPSAEKVEKQKKARKQKTLEEKARSSKAWNYTSEEDVNKIYDQRKVAAQRKFDQGKTHQNYDNDADRQAALDLELEELDQLREITLKHLREQAEVEPEAPAMDAELAEGVAELTAGAVEFEALQKEMADLAPRLINPETAEEAKARLAEIEQRLEEMKDEARSANRKLGVEEAAEATAEAPATETASAEATPDDGFDYNAQLRELTAERNRRIAFQRKLLAEDPDKSEGSFHQAVKRINEWFEQEKAKLDRKQAQRTGISPTLVDTRTGDQIEEDLAKRAEGIRRRRANNGPTAAEQAEMDRQAEIERINKADTQERRTLDKTARDAESFSSAVPGIIKRVMENGDASKRQKSLGFVEDSIKNRLEELNRAAADVLSQIPEDDTELRNRIIAQRTEAQAKLHKALDQVRTQIEGPRFSADPEVDTDFREYIEGMDAVNSTLDQLCDGEIELDEAAEDIAPGILMRYSADPMVSTSELENAGVSVYIDAGLRLDGQPEISDALIQSHIPVLGIGILPVLDNPTLDIRAGENGSIVVDYDSEDPAPGLSARQRQMTLSVTFKPETKVIHVSYLRVPTRYQNGGISTAALDNMIKKAIELGYEKIEAQAARRDGDEHFPGMNGYYTWPSLGFDADLQNNRSFPKYSVGYKTLEASGLPTTTIQDVYNAPGGREWWKEYGKSIDVSFDLREGSKSRQIYDERRAFKEKLNQKVLGYTADLSGRRFTADQQSFYEGTKNIGRDGELMDGIKPLWVDVYTSGAYSGSAVGSILVEDVSKAEEGNPVVDFTLIEEKLARVAEKLGYTLDDLPSPNDLMDQIDALSPKDAAFREKATAIFEKALVYYREFNPGDRPIKIRAFANGKIGSVLGVDRITGDRIHINSIVESVPIEARGLVYAATKNPLVLDFEGLELADFYDPGFFDWAENTYGLTQAEGYSENGVPLEVIGEYLEETGSDYDSVIAKNHETYGTAYYILKDGIVKSAKNLHPTSDYRMNYSADPEIEELMDRSDEFYRDENQAQANQGGLSSSADLLNRQEEILNELTEQYANAKTDKEKAEIEAKMAAAYAGELVDTKTLQKSRADDLAKEEQAQKASKDEITASLDDLSGPLDLSGLTLTDAKDYLNDELKDLVYNGVINPKGDAYREIETLFNNGEITQEQAQERVQEVLELAEAIQAQRDKLSTVIDDVADQLANPKEKWQVRIEGEQRARPDSHAKRRRDSTGNTVIPPKKQAKSKTQKASTKAAPAKPIIPKAEPKAEPKTAPVPHTAPTEFDVPLSEVSGPFNVAGLTIGKAKDKVYQAVRNLRGKETLTEDEQVKLVELTAQYEKLQKVIADHGKQYDLRIEGLTKEQTRENNAAAKAFRKAQREEAKQAKQTKAAPEAQITAPQERPRLPRKGDPVDVKGLKKQDAIQKVTTAKATHAAWYDQEIEKLDQRNAAKLIDDESYGKQWGKLKEEKQKVLSRYDDQIKKLEVMDEPVKEVKEKATVIKDDSINYEPKTGKWWTKIRDADGVAIRRLRSDRNTYDVRLTSSNGTVTYLNEVSPSRIEQMLGERWKETKGGKQIAKDRLSPAYTNAEKSLGVWQEVNMIAPAKAESAEQVKKPKVEREHDNYDREISVKLSQRMSNSTVRDNTGKLLNVYRLGPANALQNANPNSKFTIWSEKPATMNLRRGMNGAEAYDQVGKRSGARIEGWLQELAEHPGMSDGNKEVIRQKIAAEERKNREYSTGITHLDPWRTKYAHPGRESVAGGHTLLEGYIDIRKPLVLDAKGRSMGFVEKMANDFINDPKNLAGQVDTDGNPLGEYDGLKIINVRVTQDNQTLGGGSLDNDTVYVTFRHNQGKSTYNSDPTNSDLMQYSADPETDSGYEEGSLPDMAIKILQGKDINTAVEELALYMSRLLQTGEMPKEMDEQTREAIRNQMSPEEKAILERRAQQLIGEYGRIKPGANPARNVFMPKKTAENQKVKQNYRTFAESSNTPEWGVDYILRDALTSEDAVYESVTDKASIASADREYRNKGYDQALAELRAKMDSEAAYKITKKDIALGIRLYQEAFAIGDTETALALVAELAEVAHTSGQNLQATQLIKNMPKAYQLYYMRRVVNRFNQRFAKRIDSGAMPEIVIRKDLAKAVLNAKTQEDLEKAMDALLDDVASQVPATIGDKWNAWRYLAMLGNPKTHFRNVAGNAIFMPAKFAKDLVAAGIESVFIKDPKLRHTSFKGLLGGKANAEIRALAERDYEGIKQELQSGGKYNPEDEIMERRTIFGNKFLEAMRKFNENKLEDEDGKFLRLHYINSLTNFLVTQGMSVEQLESTKEGRKIMSAARMYAFNEAQKATYRDASQFAAALNQMKQNTGLVGGILLEGVLPFTKTPINILKRGVEYSPIGLLKTFTYNAYQMKNGSITANEFIDNAAAGLTGTGIALLGMLLTSLGLLRGGDDDDEKKDDFEKLQGYQNYSLNIGGINYTIDWMAPSALPLFVGSEIYNTFKDGDALSAAEMWNAMTVVAEPITQLSMLSGLNDLMKSGKWDEHPLSSAIMTMGSGYFTQALPTLLAQVSRSLVADRRTTYVDKNSDIPQPLQRWWQTNVLGKTPLNAQRTEYIDAWGRKDTTALFIGRLAENMLSPGYINRIKTTPVDEELTRLAKEVGSGVLMTAPQKSIEFNNETHHLTADQYAAYTKARGDAAFTMYTELFNSQGYQDAMSDDEKAYAVNLIRNYANIIGKQAVFPEYVSDDDNWAEKCDGDMTRVMNTAMLKAKAHEAGIKWDDSSEFFQYVIGSDWLSPVDQAYAVAQMLSLTNDKVYFGGEKVNPTTEQKRVIEEHYRQIFPAYYMDLVLSSQWTSADWEQRVKLLSKARSEAKADSKSWFSQVYG